MIKKRFVSGGIAIILSLLVYLYGQTNIVYQTNVLVPDKSGKIIEEEQTESGIKEIIKDEKIEDKFIDNFEDDNQLQETEIDTGGGAVINEDIDITQYHEITFDLNNDGKINLKDLSIFRANYKEFQKTNVFIELIDLNYDLEINETDSLIMNKAISELNNTSKNIPDNDIAIPESNNVSENIPNDYIDDELEVNIDTETETITINSFQECVEKGYPILESFPEQCQTPSGEIFTNTGSEIPNQ